MKLVPTYEVINTIDIGLTGVLQATLGLKKVVKNKLDADKKAIVARDLAAFKANDAEKKVDAEKLLEAKKPESQIGPGGANNALSKGGGPIQRLLKALGAIIVGFVLDKLPQIINEVNRIRLTVQRIFQSIKKMWDSAVDAVTSIMDVGKQLWENVINLDFFDSEGKLRNSIDEAISDIDGAKNDWGFEVQNIKDSIKDWVNGKGVKDIKAAMESGGGPAITDSGSSSTPSSSSTSTPSLSEKTVSSGTAQTQVKKAGFQQGNFSTFRDIIASKESGGKYDIQGGSGNAYAGRYQMGAAAREDAARYLGETYEGDSESAREKFRKDPEMQERYFAAYTRANHEYLSGNPEYDSLSEREKLEVLAYAHNAGWSNALKWLKNKKQGSFKDGFGTKSSTYADAVRGAFNKPQPQPSVQPQTPKAGNVNLVDTGYVDYKGRKIMLNSTGPKGNVAADFKRMAAAAAEEGIDIGSGISSSYRDPETNANTQGSAKNSAHMYGEAFDINWNSAAGKWIRKNAHKYGFIHADYSATSTHFNHVGGSVNTQPPSTKISSSNTGPTKLDPSALEEPDSPTMVPFPINSTVAKNESGGSGSGSKSSPPSTSGGPDYSQWVSKSLTMRNFYT